MERNRLRANLVRQAEAWPWSSLAWRADGPRPELLCDGRVACPRNWVALVNAVQREGELAALRRSVVRGAPFGAEHWQRQIAKRLG